MGNRLIYLAIFTLWTPWVWANNSSQPSDPFLSVDPPSNSAELEPERSRCGNLPNSDRLRALSRQLCAESVRLAESSEMSTINTRANRAIENLCYAPLHAVVQTQARICAGELRVSRRLSVAEHARETAVLDSRLSMIQAAERYAEDRSVAQRIANSYRFAEGTADRWIGDERNFGYTEIGHITRFSNLSTTPPNVKTACNNFTAKVIEEHRGVVEHIRREWYGYFFRMAELYNRQAEEAIQAARGLCNSVSNLGTDARQDCANRALNADNQVARMSEVAMAPSGVAIRTTVENRFSDTADPSLLTNEQIRDPAMDLGDPELGDDHSAATARANAMGEQVAPSLARIERANGGQGSGFYVQHPDGRREFVSVDHVTRLPIARDHTILPEVHRQALVPSTIESMGGFGLNPEDFRITVNSRSMQTDPLLPDSDFSRAPAGALSDPALGGARPLAVGNVMDLRSGDTLYMVGYPGEARGDLATVECTYSGMSTDFELMADCPNALRFPQGMSGGVWVNRNGEAVGASASLYPSHLREPGAVTYQMQGTPLFVQQNIDELGRLHYQVGPVPRPPGLLFDGDRVISGPCQDSWSLASGRPEPLRNCSLVYREGRYWRSTNGN